MRLNCDFSIFCMSDCLYRVPCSDLWFPSCQINEDGNQIDLSALNSRLVNTLLVVYLYMETVSGFVAITKPLKQGNLAVLLTHMSIT